jgi:phage replication-related protein YjqB (UPF0714/DUF867 family)
MGTTLPEYPCFAALAEARREGRDYDRVIQFHKHAQVAILAPHGGRIEPGTDQIAAEIAVQDLSLYCFRSHMRRREANLHITSHNFDDPDCVGPLSRHRHVVTVHGCEADGELVLLGGLDTALLTDLAAAVKAAGFIAQTDDHDFPGIHARNVCNRGSTGRGVQLELSMPLRRSARRAEFVAAIREVLLARQHATQRITF